MKIYFTSDWHFKHDAIVTKFGRSQFKNIEEMQDTIINNINKMCKPDDILICLGDALFSAHPIKDKALIDRIKCRKWLIRGNHDKGDMNTYLRLGFEVVCERMVLKIASEHVLLCHRPYKKPFRLWGWLTKKWRKKWYNKNPKDNGMFLIHGHSHNKPEYRTRDRMFDCGVDANNFKPVGIWEIGNWISEYKQKRR